MFAATQSSVILKNVNISDTTVEFDGGALVVETNAVLKLISTTITNATVQFNAHALFLKCLTK
jgi:hypothetical protein